MENFINEGDYIMVEQVFNFFREFFLFKLPSILFGELKNLFEL